MRATKTRPAADNRLRRYAGTPTFSVRSSQLSQSQSAHNAHRKHSTPHVFPPAIRASFHGVFSEGPGITRLSKDLSRVYSFINTTKSLLSTVSPIFTLTSSTLPSQGA